jgi:hypothetical protein
MQFEPRESRTMPHHQQFKNGLSEESGSSIYMEEGKGKCVKEFVGSVAS